MGFMMLLIVMAIVWVRCNAFEELTINFLRDIQTAFNSDWLVYFIPVNLSRIANPVNILKLRKSVFTYISMYTSDDLFKINITGFSARAPIVLYNYLKENSENLAEQFESMHRFQAYNRFTWIVITEDDILNELEGIYIPLNCQFLVCKRIPNSETFSLVEIYKTSNLSKLYNNEYGVWDSSSKLITDSNSFLYRRMDFHQQGIVVNENKDGTGGIFQRLPWFLPDAWKVVAQRLNITSVYVSGSKTFDVDTNANALLGPPEPGEEYIHILFNVRINLFYKEVETRFGLTSYLNPFSGYVWILIIAWIIVTSCFMSFIMTKTPRKTKDMEANFAWRVLDVLAILSQQDMILNSESDSIRLVAALNLLSSMLFFGVYSAVFISFIAVSIHKSPFDESSLEGVLREGKYKILVLEKKAYPFFLHNTHPTVKALLKKQVPPPDQLPLTFQEGFSRVCSPDGKYLTEFPPALIDDLKPTLSKCKISQDSIFLNAFPGTWIFKKDSPYRSAIQLSMLKLTESGAVSNYIIFRKLFLKKKTGADSLDPIELGQVISLFAIFLIGLATTLLIFFVEKLVLWDRNAFGNLKRENAYAAGLQA